MGERVSVVELPSLVTDESQVQARLSPDLCDFGFQSMLTLAGFLLVLRFPASNTGLSSKILFMIDMSLP
jgi:hypothetical protein